MEQLDLPGYIRIKIGNHGWKQIGGDINPGAHGGTIARADGSLIEIREIQPTRAHVGDGEAAEIGFPFWTRDGNYTIDDLNFTTKEVKSAMSYVGLSLDDLEDLTPEVRATAIAEALHAYGSGVDEGPAGWAEDVVPGKVLWWGSKNPTGWRYLKDEDRDFRVMLREMED